MEKIGLFGGTFDPIHNLHIKIAKQAKSLLDLDWMILIPTGNPPHKNNQRVTPFHHRYNMVQLAIEDISDFSVSDIENKLGLVNSYTTDTLDVLSSVFLNDTLYFIVGSDSIFDIENWKNPANIFNKSVLVVFPRPNVSSFNKLEKQIDYLKKKYNATIELIEIKGEDLSSTEVRLDLQDGVLSKKSIDNKVAEYIQKYHLYEEKIEGNLNKSELQTKLSSILSKSRYEHTLGVEEMAVKLAKCYNQNIVSARTAALFHDYAKAMNRENLLNIIRKYGAEIDVIEERNVELLHAKAAALIAEQEYNISNLDTINAIRYHTTGRAEMSQIEKIIFVSDAIEMNRHYPGVDDLREQATVDLDGTMLNILNNQITFLVEKNKLVHQDSISARNSILVHLRAK